MSCRLLFDCGYHHHYKIIISLYSNDCINLKSSFCFCIRHGNHHGVVLIFEMISKTCLFFHIKICIQTRLFRIKMDEFAKEGNFFPPTITHEFVSLLKIYEKKNLFQLCYIYTHILGRNFFVSCFSLQKLSLYPSSLFVPHRNRQIKIQRINVLELC